MDFLQSLNVAQLRAVLQTEGPLLVLAGAGSGKTRVISYRAAYLIGDGHAEAHQVLAVTFTNKAAQEMRDRVERLLTTDCSRLWIYTFHAFCARMLRREGPAIGLSRDFVIYDSTDQLAVVRRALRDLDIDDKLLPARLALSLISQAKNQMVDLETLRGESWSARGEMAAKVSERYQRALHEANALDFDDLLLRTVELFETDERVKRRYSEQFRFIMVDEYQDTNQPQYRLIRQLADHHRNLCVVGDPDQSIYKWRGADLRNIMDFEQDFSEATVVRLEQNYRSTQVILDAASAVIRQNRNRQEKRLWTDRSGGAPIRYFRAGDELEEADFVTARLRETLAGRDRGRRCAVSHQRPVARPRGRADPRGADLQDHRRCPLLRAEGDQGRARLPSAADKPGRRRQPAPGHQRPDPRHRQGGDDLARRARARAGRRRATVRRRRRDCRFGRVAVAAADASGRRDAADHPRRHRAAAIPRSDPDAPRHRVARAGV